MLASTPIERHHVEDEVVLVKREDLCAPPPYPPLGKLRGLHSILNKRFAEGTRLFGCWDTRVSKLGVGLAAAVRNYRRAKAILYYPHLQGGAMPEPMAVARELGAEIVPMRGNHPLICWAQAKKLVEAKGGVMLPFGLECQESVDAVSTEASTVPFEYAHGGTVIMSCGSAVTLSGVMLGLRGRPQRIIGLSAGRSIAKLEQCVRRYVKEVPTNLQLVPPEQSYRQVCSDNCPFPSHPHYDRKAWSYLKRRVGTLQRPILFWNIGA